MKNKGSVVQLDRISDFGSEGWGFESSLGHEYIKKNWNKASLNKKFAFYLSEADFSFVDVQSGALWGSQGNL